MAFDKVLLDAKDRQPLAEARIDGIDLLTPTLDARSWDLLKVYPASTFSRLLVWRRVICNEL